MNSCMMAATFSASLATKPDSRGATLPKMDL
jgi:hypothetical protein